MAYRYKHFPTYNGDFRVLRDCQNLYGDVCIATAQAPRELRHSVLKDYYEICKLLIFSVRRANNEQLGSQKRIEGQNDVIEYIQQLQDLLPSVRRLRCITYGQEKDITVKIDNIKIAIDIWIDSDEKRIKKMESESK